MSIEKVARVVALGASNLTRGFRTVVSTARAMWGAEVQVLAALGYGRSYGAKSRVLFRTLPGILESGLWRALDSMPAVQTRALVTDVGNDIMYGYSTDQIFSWVEEAVRRLQEMTQDITLTSLPLFSIRRLSRAKFLVFRRILFPACRLSHAQVVEAAERLDAGLAELANSHGLRFFQLKPTWYGLDLIHIRQSWWQPAWREILGVSSLPAGDAGGMLEGLKLRLRAPESRWLFGMEQFTPQTGAGGIWLY